MKSIKFTLAESIDFQHKGETLKSKVLELHAPSAKNRKNAAKLKQGFMRAINDLEGRSGKSQQDSNAKIKADEILTLLQMTSVDYDEYIDIFIALITDGVCLVNSKEPLTSLRVDDISFDDLEKLMGEYLVNFTLGSLEKMMKG